MKNLILLFVCTFIVVSGAFAKPLPPVAPKCFAYQAVLRDATGNLMENKPVTILISLIEDNDGNGNGLIAYRESHSKQTNQFGLVSMEIGCGTALSGNFENLDWGTNNYWLEVEVNGQIMGKSRLLAVPYALHSGSAEALQVVSGGERKGGCSATGIPFWTNLGNDNVNDTCHFIGTTKDVDFVLKTNNAERMRITKGGALRVLNDATIADNLFVSGTSVRVHRQLNVDQDATIAEDLTVGGQLYVNGDFHVKGMLEAKCITILGGCDLYEFSLSTDDIQPGEVAVIDPNGGANAVRRSARAYDPLVTGVVSGAGGINPGMGLTQAGVLEGNSKIAMGGKVMVRVVGNVEPGDLLTTSDTPGCAMAVKNRRKAFGAVIGKALSGPNAEGLVLMLVMMR
ncbi:MAG: hypothetical protein IPH12_06975 [Saprospirales bacterium]|nr:hypothetical protein [Saprospirales bacterium]